MRPNPRIVTMPIEAATGTMCISNVKIMMKRILSLLFFFCLGWAAFSQTAVISGTLSGCEEGTKILVLNVEGSKLLIFDSVVPDAKGAYRVERFGESPDFFILALMRPGQKVNDPDIQHQMVHVMLLASEKVQMNIEYVSDTKSVRVGDVSGSANMELYRRFNNLLFNASVNTKLRATLPRDVEHLLADNCSNLMSAFLVTFFDEDFANHGALYKRVRDVLTPQYGENNFVRYIDGKLQNVLVAGMEAPDVVMKDRDGNTRRLSDLRGKVVLLDFWASWCRPCRMENPNVVRLYHQYHEKGFDIFSVSLDNSRDAWLKAIKDDGLIWENHVSDLKGWTSSGGKLYGVASIPATVLVAPDGTIIARNLRGAELEAKLKELFDQ